jgi:hypothetical protein
MDTMTYASVAVLPGSVALSKRQLAVPEAAFTPLDLSYLHRSIRTEISKLKAEVRKLWQAIDELRSR